MGSLLKIVFACMAMLPLPAFAGTNCHVEEFPDHFEAVCFGDEASGSVLAELAAATRTPAAPPAPPAPPSTAQETQPAAAGSPPPQSSSVQKLIDFRQQETQKRALRDAARASRLQTIRKQAVQEQGN